MANPQELSQDGVYRENRRCRDGREQQLDFQGNAEQAMIEDTKGVIELVRQL